MPPFSKSNHLVRDFDSDEARVPTATLPGVPSVMLMDSALAREFLRKELWSADLESIAPRLWIMTTFSSSNINALHCQRVKDREIIVTEDPRLHLVWIHHRIFIKPLPRNLLSQAFWKMYLSEGSNRLGNHRSDICKATTGFLRTYRYLIQHESDFNSAQQDGFGLIPKDVNWASFCRFSGELCHIEDSDVSGRYCYGELRLTRLNLYAPVLLRKFHYEQVYRQYGDFLVGSMGLSSSCSL